MSVESQAEERRKFYGRPGEQVCPDFANHWVKHGINGREKESNVGEGRILALDVQSGLRYYVVESVILYSDEYTRHAWPQTPQRIKRNEPSRSEEIKHLESGEIICYPFYAHTIPYIHTLGAENIQLDALIECDNFGTPLPGNETLLTASKIAPLVGLTKERGRNLAQLTPFDFRGNVAFLLAVGSAPITEERLRRFGEEMFGNIEPVDE